MDKEIKVLITSAGTASAISVIKSLRIQKELKVYIIAVDINPMAAGLFLADEKYIVPKVSSAQYIQSLLDILKTTNASILIPIYSQEISIIAKNKNIFDSQNIKTLLPPHKSIDLCNNKKEMHQLINDLGISSPKTFTKKELLSTEIKNHLPLFYKPNTGSSSKNTGIIYSYEKLQQEIGNNENFIYQEYIEAEEVTVDVFCNKPGVVKVISPRLRLETKAGQSVKGKTIATEIFEAPVKLICKSLKMLGACNIQFFIKDKILTFIEINPRFAAGGLMLTVKAGANIPLLLLKTLLGIETSNHETLVKENYFITRYWEEIVYHEEI